MALSISDALYGELVDLGYTGSLSDLQYALLTDENPPGGSVNPASETEAGIVELATDAEAITGTDTERVTTPANVKAVIDALIGGAPGALDTLDELAAALGDDSSFATTVTNSLALKSPLASPSFTGTVSQVNTHRTKGIRKGVPASKTAGFTISLGDEEVYFCAPSSSFSVTLPATTEAGHVFTVHKTDTDTTKTITLTGTFNDGSVTNFILRGLGQWVTFMTTSVSGTFQVIEASSCVVPTGTGFTGLTNGILFVEYTP